MNELDPTDLAILNMLQNNSRLSHKQIGDQLHKSATPIHNRIRRLQNDGYIKRYATILNNKKIDRGLVGFIQVTLKEHSFEALTAFKQAVVKLDEVMECYHMNGHFDFLLRIAIRDMDEYNEVLMTKLSKLPDVGNMQSHFVMSEIKHETAYQLVNGK